MSQRENLSFNAPIESDAAPLNGLIADVLAAAPDTRCFRDPTRGGLASTLNELGAQSGVDMVVSEDDVPVKNVVRGACDMLGYDVFQVANEGKMVCIVPAERAEAALAAMKPTNTAPMPPLSAAVEEQPTRPAVQSLPGTGYGTAPHSPICSWVNSFRAFVNYPQWGQGTSSLPPFLRPHPPLHHVASTLNR